MKKRIFSLMMALVVFLSFPLTAYAATSSVTYTGHKLFDFNPGSEFTDTDLFDNFKGVMPGDVLTEKIRIENKAKCCDYIKVYIRADLHDQDNPLSDEVAEHENLVSMEDFLSQLHMTVKKGTKVIYEESPDKLDGFKKNVYLGTFRRNKGTTLTVELEVPAELGNAYANRVGEVDWIFTVEEYDDESDGPKTGDEMMLLSYVLMFGAGLAGMVVLLLIGRRKKNTKA